MRFTIRRQIVALAVAGFVLVITAGAIGYRGTVHVDDAQRSVRDAAAALRAVQSTDIARAVFRGDVLAALVTNNATERQAVLDRLGAHVAQARTGIDDVVRYTPTLRVQADAAIPLLDDLIASGQRMVTLASRVASDPTRRGALAALPGYDKADERFSEELRGLESAITAKVTRAYADAADASSAAKTLTVVIGLLAALVLGGAALLLARRIARRMDRCLTAAGAVADHDLTVTAPVDGSDELAELGGSLNDIVGSLRRALSEIGDNAKSVAAASEELTATSRQLSHGAGTASSEALDANQSIGRVTTSVAETTEAAQGLQSSIHDITAAAAEAGEVAAEAVHLADTTNNTIERLRASSDQVSAVVSMINAIARQTNLLALNATIEAARAGDQGKGFAVVAGEVKELSRATAQATEDIDAKVTAMQTDTAGATEAIARIGEVITRINELQHSISAAVDRQTYATNQIAGSVRAATTSSAGVANSIGRVAETTHLTYEAATQTEAAAKELAQLSQRLRLKFHPRTGHPETRQLVWGRMSWCPVHRSIPRSSAGTR